MKILLDPTQPEFTTLKIEQGTPEPVFRYEHSKRDCGAALIRKLSQLNIAEKDELRVVVGPGNFTAIRTACLVGNAVKMLTNCQLFSRTKAENSFKKVTQLNPYYDRAPSITPAKK